MSGWSQQHSNTEKRNHERKRDDAFLNTIGVIASFVIAALIVVLLSPAFVIAVATFIATLVFKRTRWLTYGSLGALGIFVGLVLWQGWQEIFQFAPFALTIVSMEGLIPHAENFLNGGNAFAVSVASVLMNVGLGIIIARAVVAVYEFYKGKIIKSSADEKKKYRGSEQFSKIKDNRLAITSKEQEKWRKNVQSRIEKKQEIPEVFLGIDEYGEKVHMDKKELDKHVLLQGTTGSGKTVAIFTIAETALANEESVFMVDGKGDIKTVDQLSALAERYNRTLHVFREDTALTYNPIKRGNRTSVTDRIMAIFDWSNEFYKNEAENFLQKLIHFIDEYGLPRDIETVVKYMSRKRIYKVIADDQQVWEEIVTEEVEVDSEDGEDDDILGVDTKKETKVIEKTITRSKVSNRATYFMERFFQQSVLFDEDEFEAFMKKDDETAKVVQGMRSQLEKLLYSELGHLFKEKANGIDLYEIMQKRESVIFSFNSNSYAEFIKRFARFVIADISNNITEMYKSNQKISVQGIFDEFGAYGSSTIVDINARARSAGFSSIIGIQSLGDLIIDGQDIAQQVIDNNNTFIFGLTHSPESAQKASDVIGTYDDTEVLHQFENVTGSRIKRIEMKANRGMTRNKEVYYITPEELKNFTVGQFAVARKASSEGEVADRRKIVYFRNPVQEV
uniref:type IV secretory system conjugative DNA transfer family protein n=1 Tax=Bacillaceae bacterium JMAK1 TaxID=1028381 RepID=UPI0003AC2153|nr:helicase HerA-like domain-containing protein [Bacillaceae bacterium JMAK1]AGQ45442.1 Putative TraG/TraD/VirD4 family protein [Bacillaceae bacterium JMAK1]